MTTHVRFDESEARTSTSVTTDGSVLQSLRQMASQSGIDPIAELYNEALELAHEGHYGEAQGRLHVLLALAPSDGESHLLLAKVYVAGQQWRRALASLDEAVQCGAVLPEGLRDGVVRHLNSDDEQAEAERAARSVREQGEIRKLRSETRALRGDNANLTARNRALEAETTRWAWISTFTSLVAIAFLIGHMLFDTAPPAAVVADVTPLVEGEAAVAANADGTQGDSPRNLSVAELAGEALTNSGVLEGAELEVVVRTTKAQLSGKVRTHEQLLKAAEIVAGVEGIKEVGTNGVIVLAVRDGATHTVKSGDTLGAIAYQYYGKSSLHTKIVEANPSLGPKANLKVGASLVLPPVRDEG
jgi:LysM repeat protein